MIGVGVDFGTSNSTVALFDGRAVTLVPLEPAGPIMPTATYIDRDYQVRVGQAAIDRYVADNTGRRVELVPLEVIGKAYIAVSEGSETSRQAGEALSQNVYGMPEDVGLQGRLFRGVKRLLGDPQVRRLVVFRRLYRLVALITPVLLHMRRTTAAQLAAPGAATSGPAAPPPDPFPASHVGHPVNYEGRDEHRNQLALTRLDEACGHAGFARRSFYPEPVAATLSYLHAGGGGSRMLTLDFGGGTLDLCVLARDAAGFRVLSTHGVALGGDHLDQALFAALLFPLLGKGERWRRRGVDRDVVDTLFPFDEYEPMLTNWAVTYLLNQNRYTAQVADMIAAGGPAAAKFARLRDHITHNLGYGVFQAIKDAKARLSDAAATDLDVPDLDVHVRLTRSRFEAIIAPQLAQVAAAVDAALARSGLPAGAIDCVIRTGGSSLIPAVRDILEARFPGRVVEHDPFTSVAAGLAIASYHDYRFQTG
jgi:hypothetical chaperone protein